ncbi:hypothetical protein [Cupriavidus pinatubonensis]|uniref:hypothetical protein n=1 Tax=Cupriavidus pinatubonensis TaxID=248026 RepID=UPI0037BFEC0C
MAPSAARNPYWDREGLTFEDPDGQGGTSAGGLERWSLRVGRWAHRTETHDSGYRAAAAQKQHFRREHRR